MPNRVVATLSANLERNLLAYATAASAAGLGMLVFAQIAEARIVYTPVHQLVGPNTIYNLNLNNTGRTDFSLRNVTDTFEGSGEGFLFVNAARQQNGVRGFATSLFHKIYYANALPAGTRVGPEARFMSGTGNIFLLFGDATEGCHGSWNDVKHRYLGLKLLLKHETHYGWARLNVTCDPTNRHIKAVLTGYAYETKPNKAIVTGDTGTANVKPAGLGHLALGASGKLSVAPEH